MISPAIVAKITVTAVTMIVSWMIRQRDASGGPSLATYCQCMLPVGNTSCVCKYLRSVLLASADPANTSGGARCCRIQVNLFKINHSADAAKGPGLHCRRCRVSLNFGCGAHGLRGIDPVPVAPPASREKACRQRQTRTPTGAAVESAGIPDLEVGRINRSN